MTVDTPAVLSEFLTHDEPADYLLLHGDALTVLRNFPAASVDMVITSPPYWSQRKYSGNSRLGQEATYQEYVDRLLEIFAELPRILRPEGSFWLNLGDTYRDKNLCGIPWRVALALQDAGWILRNSVIWNKVKGNPCNAKDKLRNMHEPLFHFVRQREYYYDLDAIREPPKATTRKNGRIVTATGVSGIRYEQQIRRSQALTEKEREQALLALRETLERVERGELYDFRMVIRGQQRATHSDEADVSGRAEELDKRGFYILPYHPKGPKPGDVWDIIPEDTWRTDHHYALFPEALCEIPVKATCPPGGVVLDPFVGTGTALYVARHFGRRGIGIDISREYLDTAEKRLSMVQMVLL